MKATLQQTVLPVVLIVCLTVGASILYDQWQGGPDAREASQDTVQIATRLVAIADAQQEADATADCRSKYAAADRVAGSNLDVTKAEEIDLFAQAVLLGNVTPLARQFDEAHRRTIAAKAERISVAAVQGDISANCDPDRKGGIVPAPDVDPIQALEEP